ncbi:hypothetical protein [Kribbella aluminosa]|uniref:hypothetical protein n=1 Tax=Kribbella aluminosa TaxID=416017 RepID=UPI0031E101F5
MFARKHGYVWYSVDAHTFDHEQRAAAAGLHELGAGPGAFDRGPMILEDIHAPTIVEGAFVTPTMAGTGPNAVWLMPSKPEQLARLHERNPGANHEGLIWGWQLINDQLAGTTATVINVDNQTIPQTLNALEQHFAPLLTAHPTPDTPTRQSFIRTSNNQLVVQAHARNRTTPITFDCECADPTCTDVVELTPTALSQARPAILSPRHT